MNDVVTTREIRDCEVGFGRRGSELFGWLSLFIDKKPHLYFNSRDIRTSMLVAFVLQ